MRLLEFDSTKSHAATTYLEERDGVQAVLGGDLKADRVAALGVPGGLGAGLDLAVDLVVVAGGEDAQVVGGGDGRAVGRGLKADSGAVASDGGLLHIIASRGASEETLVADHGVDVGGGALEKVEEGAAVEVGLLEVQVELSTAGLRRWQEAEDTLSLKALGEVVGHLDLGLERVGRVPRLREGQTFARAMVLVLLLLQLLKPSALAPTAALTTWWRGRFLAVRYPLHCGAQGMCKWRGGGPTIGLIRVFSLELDGGPGKSQRRGLGHVRRELSPHGLEHTAPTVAFSWLLLPVTLKATLLGALLLTSSVPAERW